MRSSADFTHEIVRSPAVAGVANKKAKHIFTARFRKHLGRHYFFNSSNEYESGAAKIACVADWFKHTDMNADWVIEGPNGAKFEWPKHKIPKNSSQSWEFLEVEDQQPGEWTCRVTTRGEPVLESRFVLK